MSDALVDSFETSIADLNSWEMPRHFEVQLKVFFIHSGNNRIDGDEDVIENIRLDGHFR